jgi:hypothetical protein
MRAGRLTDGGGKAPGPVSWARSGAAVTGLERPGQNSSRAPLRWLDRAGHVLGTIFVQRCAKFAGALFPRPFVYLVDGTRPIRCELIGGNHSQHFGDCFSLAVPAR